MSSPEILKGARYIENDQKLAQTLLLENGVDCTGDPRDETAIARAMGLFDSLRSSKLPIVEAEARPDIPLIQQINC